MKQFVSLSFLLVVAASAWISAAETSAPPVAPDKSAAPAQKAAPAKEAAPPAVAAPAPKKWKMEDLAADIEDLGKGRDFIRAGRVFQAAACGNCHSFSTYWQGTGYAPDLTSASRQFSRENILKSILEPSAEVNGRFINSALTLKSGAVVTGMIMGEEDGKVLVAPSVMRPDLTLPIPESDIASRDVSTVSPMPDGLVDSLTKEQILDLLAFIESGGNADSPLFRP